MVPFQMCNCTAPDALTHRERHRIYPGGPWRSCFPKGISHFWPQSSFPISPASFLYHVPVWLNIFVTFHQFKKEKENSKVNWNTWYYFCSIMKTICCKIFCRFKKTNKLNSFCKEIKETNCINVDMHDVRVHALMLATACDVRCHYKCNFFL